MVVGSKHRSLGGSLTEICGVHGIGQQVRGPAQLADEWTLALKGGLEIAGLAPSRVSVSMAFYGSLFRPLGRVLAYGEPPA
jgi:hypothetical protein